MGLLTPYFVPGEGFLYTIIVLGGGFLLPSSRVPGVCPGGGMVLDEIDTCITFVRNLYTFMAEAGCNMNRKSENS